MSEGTFEAARLTVRLGAIAANLDDDPTGELTQFGAMAKAFASDVSMAITTDAVQLLGGYGYMGEYVVERLWRDAKLLEIGGGTIEAHQKNITKDLCRAPELIRR